MEASILQELIHQKTLIAFQTTATKLDKITMLNTSYEHHFIQKLFLPLSWAYRQLFNSHLCTIW